MFAEVHRPPQFPLAELEHCAYHPQEPVFSSGDNNGAHPCCGQASSPPPAPLGPRGTYFSDWL